jgi:hypothetical protein
MNNPALTSHVFNIPTGVLTLVVPSCSDPHELLSVQARHNPKRGFLFVSKVLGKHLAVSLENMRQTYRVLAEKSWVNLAKTQGDVLVIGMAETATQLGYGVWRELDALLESQQRNAFFLQSTRYKKNDQAVPFEESHSHAPSQWIHGLDSDVLKNVKVVVLVDDELSTGKTFHGLARVVKQHLDVQQMEWVCLTDFRPVIYQDKDAASLLQGEWSFDWTNSPGVVALSEGVKVESSVLPIDFGRVQPLSREEEQQKVTRASQQLGQWLAHHNIQGRVLVLGSGEFMPLPFRLAEILEQTPDIESVSYQATTRSPALMPRVDLGLDHYGEGVQQYLYNYHPEDFDAVVLVLETDPEGKAQELGQMLNAHVLVLNDL